MNPPEDPLAAEESLDPADWQALRTLGHRMVDEMMAYLETVRDRPVWRPIPESVKSSLRAPVPLEPSSAESVYEDFRRDVLPYPLGNVHPRFWGWVIGTGTPFGALSEMLAATMNPNMGGGDHVANHVELQVIEWLKHMLGYPAEASGLLVSGGSMANLVGLTVARNARAEVDVVTKGLQASSKRMVLYASTETHNSVRKAMAVLGLGHEAWHEIPTDAEYRIDLTALRKTITADRAAGALPFCVVGNAGTVNTGAIDDLDALANLCEAEDLWFHVDGAFGALAAIVDDLRPLVRGMERADSLAFDLHKWMYMPFEVGCALVRDAEEHRRAFTSPAEYLVRAERGAAGGSIWFSDYGIQLSRGFRALKVWMSLKEHGARKYARLIRQNVEQAKYLGRLVESSPELELMAPIALNIVCFRFVDRSFDDVELDSINQEILYQLQESGVALPSSTRIRNRLTLRVAIVNQRSRRSDFELLVREVVERGRKLLVTAGRGSPAV